jgi:SAM-dependent methyltransferase
MTNSHDTAEQIRAEYKRRAQEIPADAYALHHPANLFINQGQTRALLWALKSAGMFPLAERRILEVGSGRGNWLATLEAFEAQRERLAGIDLDVERSAHCARRFPGADIRVGDASKLPWSDGEFDVVLQSTVFTSILDAEMKQAVAREMLRVLKPQGAILWYDFHMNNPRNPHVRGVGRGEIRQLFPGCRMTLRRVTLAPPLARRLVPVSWIACELLEKLRLLNTHYFGVLRRYE